METEKDIIVQFLDTINKVLVYLETRMNSDEYEKLNDIVHPICAKARDLIKE